MKKALPKTARWDKAILSGIRLNNFSVMKPSLGPQPQTDKESVKKALNKMKKGKVSGTSGVVSETLSVSGNMDTEQMTNIFNKIIAENKVPQDWDTSVIVDCFKVRQLNKQTN